MSLKPAEESTVIGKSVTIRGELSASEDLYLDGEFHGHVSLEQNRLTIGPNARVLANLKVRDLVVFGHLEGNIHATGRVDLRQTAIVLGDITAARLSVEEKASIKGKVELLGSQAAAAAPAPRPAAESTAPATTPLFAATGESRP